MHPRLDVKNVTAAGLSAVVIAMTVCDFTDESADKSSLAGSCEGMMNRLAAPIHAWLAANLK